MDDVEFRIMPVGEARRALTNGDLRSDVAFQNDVNRLLASLDDLWGLSKKASEKASEKSSEKDSAPKQRPRRLAL